jgi:subfamily B ATP-binding cassette protein MsbA
MADSEKKGKKDKKALSLSVVWRESRDLLWERRGKLALGLGLLLVSRISGMVLPATTKVLIDDVIGEGRSDLLLWIALAGGAATLVQAVTGFALAILLGVTAQRSINDLRMRVQQHVLRLPVGYFENHKTGELISRVLNDAEGLRNLVGSGFVQLVGGMVSSVIALGVLFWHNWRLTLVTLFFLILFGSVMTTGFRRLRPIFRERWKLQADLQGRLNESFGGVRIVKAYTAEKREDRIFAQGAHELLRNIIRSMVGVATITSAAGLLFGLVGIAMAIAGAREVLAGRMTVGDVFMFMVFTGLMVTPLVQMSSIGTQVASAFAGLDRLREVLSEQREEDDEGREPLGEIAGDVRFEDVWFEYKEGTPVLRGVDFETPAGTTTALVGSSGAGKSTVIGLVMAFRQPNAGRVLVDGRDLAAVRLHDYRRQLGVVLQDDFLFDGTIAENIAFSKPGATREEIEEVGRLAHCDQFVAGFDESWDTVIGERGVKLSGGQRQRVAIARAMLADPRVLILDEATSSLDSESEMLIQEGLDRLREGRTTFVIAHRLSTIMDADQILVLEDGEIVERGTHPELLAADGRYKALYDRQFRIATNRFVNPGEDVDPPAEPPDDDVDVPEEELTFRHLD